MKKYQAIFLVVFINQFLFSQVLSQNYLSIIGSAFSENKGYSVLQRLCDETGGRFMLTDGNVKAGKILKEELESLGYSPVIEKIIVPGWVRGNDRVSIKEPFKKDLRIAALGYCEKKPVMELQVVFCASGFEDDYDSLKINGKIALVTQEYPNGRESLLRSEAIEIAAKKGAKAILFINTKVGGSLLCGTGNFQGNPTKIPAFSITFEEGQWLKRLCELNKEVVAEVVTESHCVIAESFNTIVRIQGKTNKKIVLGGHFDSWDLGQGGVDNGLGIAILFDISRLIKKYNTNNLYTIELVWFNGEELGLWGSKKYVEQHLNDTILAMINLDMTGSPTGINALGFDDMLPAINKIIPVIYGLGVKNVSSSPYTNSDHMHFMFHGIPTIGIDAHLENDMVNYYHDFGDSFDKVSKKYLSEAAASITILALELSNSIEIDKPKRSAQMIKDLLIKNKLDKRLKRQGEWIFD